MRIRVRATSGLATLDVQPRWTVADLKAAIASQLNIPSHSQQLLTGFPPKHVIVDDAAQAADYFKSGDTIVVQTGPGGVKQPAATPTPPRRPARPAAPTNDALSRARDSSIAAQGEMVMRVVPDDNSCLFRAVNGILGRAKASEIPLRTAVAEAISSNPAMYNEAFLGRPNVEYRKWITSVNAWGGAIELGILASHFKLEIGAFDVKTMRMDRYGEGNGFSQIGYLIYDGIHYNYLALALGAHSTDTSMDVCQFPNTDVFAMHEARKVAEIANQGKRYTDTNNFLLKCDHCGVKLRGQDDAVKHANATAHGSFSEA